MTTKNSFLLLPLFFALALPVIATDEGQPTVTPLPANTVAPVPSVTPYNLDKVNRAPTRNRFKQQKQNLKVTIIQQRQDLKGTITQEKLTFLSQLKQNIVSRIAQRARNRLQARFDHLMKSKARIQNRIDEIETANQSQDPDRDMTAAKNKLAENTGFEADFQTALTAYDAKIKEILASNEPIKLMPELRQSVKDARDQLDNIRRILTETIKLIVQTKPAGEED